VISRLAMKRRALPTLIGVLALGWSALLADPAADVRSHLDLLRGIQPTSDQAKIAQLNARMDEAWGYLTKHKPEALPILRAELQAAIAARPVDQFFVLDTAYLLAREDAAPSGPLTLSALEQVDPQAPIIRANDRELFQFVMKLGASGQETERYLAQVDRIYLPNKAELNFFAAPHVVQLNANDLLCMTYGVAGEAAGVHLCAGIAKAGPDQLRLMHLLPIVCSEEDVPKIVAILQSSRDYDVISAAVTTLMTVGGPAGRAAVLGYDASVADSRTQKYLKEIRSGVKSTDLAHLDRTLAKIDRAKKMSDREVQSALDEMERRNGADDSTPPINILRAGLDPEKTLAKLKRIRALSFRRQNNHVFEDLEITNLLINALQFKRAASAVGKS
jgi:hypothetical protein